MWSKRNVKNVIDKNLLSKPGRPLSGSITVETALVLPIFLFAMLSVMYLTDSVRISAENTAALSEQAYIFAKYAYLGDKAADMSGLSAAEDMINGGDDIIDLVQRYTIDVPFDLLNAYDPKAIDRVRVRAFTGYDNTGRGTLSEKPPEEMVYVTEYGSVYHRSLGCSHLNLNIRTVDSGKISSERANNGAKYYPCEHCARGGGTPAVLYVTDDGNRYHTTLSCSDLKRTIREVPLSEVSLPPCSECGGG